MACLNSLPPILNCEYLPNPNINAPKQMRKQLKDSLCAELAQNFKSFKVRRNPLKPQNGFKISTTYKVTELRKNALNQWVVRFVSSKHDWLAENFDLIVEKLPEPKPVIKGLTQYGYSYVGEFSHVDSDGFTHAKWGDKTLKLVAIETDPIQVKAQQIDDKLKELDTFKPIEPNPDNQTVKSLVQYVSEHKDSMSKESLMHFASLIGLVKLGAL
jgi:hypothetical protein